jgi:hypothetical protein
MTASWCFSSDYLLDADEDLVDASLDTDWVIFLFGWKSEI